MSDAWRLELTAPARRDLNDIAPASAVFAIFEALESIAANPRRIGKPLRDGLAGNLVARRGPFRIVYRLDEGGRLVSVTAIGHRSHVYRRR